MTQTTLAKLPNGWKVSQIEAFNGFRKITVSFKKPLSPKKAIEELVKTVDELK